ncbi:MAG TPA: hypothetical protein VFE16_12845 [Candidatus Cybelea sp.]|nr:hypothetical protein [Candidatus Cybelea sp.]
MIRASVLASVAAIALAACGGSHGVVPQGSSFAPMSANGGVASIGGDAGPLALATCATSPPQWMWIFKGACEKFTLKSTGGKFTLGVYANLSVTGSIGYNNAKSPATIYLSDAIDKNGDVLKNKGKAFPPYKGEGTTIVYAVADNQSTQAITPKSHPNVPVIKYVITDKKAFPGNTCGAAYLAKQKNGLFGWTALPGTEPVHGKTVTISQYEVPKGLALPPKGNGLYFAINCFNK